MAKTTMQTAAIFAIACVAWAGSALAQCQGDFNDDGVVGIDELVVAVGNALNSCQVIGARFVDNGDGTITDHKTGLRWEKKDLTCPGIHCYSDTFTWSTGTGKPDGTAFTTFLYGLNDGTSSTGTATSGCFTGHCDWRLATVEELTEIQSCDYGSPCIDPIFGPTQPNFYWSATSVDGFPNLSWYSLFGIGGVFYQSKTVPNYTRAVRGGL